MSVDRHETARVVSTWLAERRTADAGSEDDPQRLLAHVADLESLSGTVNRLQHDAVYAARSAGCSWAQVGAALGVSKQAAQQRFRIREDADQPEGQRTVGPLDRAEEMEVLSRAAQEGWKLVETRLNLHVLEYAGGSWEITRKSLFQPGALPRRRDGWEAATVRFPDAFYQRSAPQTASRTATRST